jgi:hypothetical protein
MLIQINLVPFLRYHSLTCMANVGIETVQNNSMDRSPLERLLSVQLLKYFPTSYVTKYFITVFIRLLY